MDRSICIHGHFYQPPRENPWLEAIELQDSAYPYHDWNERITAECYAPNAASRILDEKDRIERIVNNYARISFNFGPTLLSWLEEKSPSIYQAILDADRECRDRFGGHGSALAQVYNHMILPLANDRDRRTQVLWGIRDFEHRFGRPPEGMWLSETAANLPTLETLAQLGIRFTILAPSQASRARRIGGRWRDVSGGRIDPARPYRLRLPSRRTLDAFFYDGPISRAVAFEGLLDNGEKFAQRLLSGFSDARDWPQLLHIATDGETYGHHHHRGEMALSYALSVLERDGAACLTNYAQFLERHPPAVEAEIFENTSWSCVHGIERWRSDCGCNSGRYPSQAWRGPLRAALDGLRDAIAEPFEEQARTVWKDPWAARDEYIAVLLDRSPENLDRFFAAHAVGEPSAADRVRAIKLLELQRHAQLMYTSCGWFFDEISGLETVQVLQYAGRALQLAAETLGNDFESRFLQDLEHAPSNLSEIGNGRAVFERYVRPAMVDLSRVAAHSAVSSLFDGYGDSTRIYCYEVEREEHRVWNSGHERLALGRARFTSRITGESGSWMYGVVNFAGHNVAGGVRPFREEGEYRTLNDSIAESFARSELPEVIRKLDAGFGQGIVSLKQLFRDEQRRIVGLILESTLADTEAVLRQSYERSLPLMRFLEELGTPLPRLFRAIVEFTLNAELRRTLAAEAGDPSRLDQLLANVGREKIRLDAETLEFEMRRNVEARARRLEQSPADRDRLDALAEGVDLARKLPFPVGFWEVQNIYWHLRERAAPARREQARQGDPDAMDWLKAFGAVGESLGIREEDGGGGA
jgi:alpha-amylase/alpha-mannosidase (GH57 family)